MVEMFGDFFGGLRFRGTKHDKSCGKFGAKAGAIIQKWAFRSAPFLIQIFVVLKPFQTATLR